MKSKSASRDKGSTDFNLLGLAIAGERTAYACGGGPAANPLSSPPVNPTCRFTNGATFERASFPSFRLSVPSLSISSLRSTFGSSASA
eukprot:scaffold286796_cov32-Tisochrysis_lutea.AAC.3